MYRRSSGGKLTHKCEDCDSSGYAEPGGKAYADRMATIAKPPAPEPAPGPALAPSPAPEPAPKKAAFSLEDLR